MSYSIYDSRGYRGDVASGPGWHSFCRWARKQGGELAHLAQYGWTDNVAGLLKETKESVLQGDDLSTKLQLQRLAVDCQDIVLVNDGTDSDAN